MSRWYSKRGRSGAQSTPPKPSKAVLRAIQDTPDLEKYLLVPSSKSNPGLNPSKSLYCGICADIFKHPMRAPCGHSFCQRCITTWLSMNKTCPQDRKPLTTLQLHHDFILETIIDESPANCPYRDQGCFLGVKPLAEIRRHAVECDFNPANIPDFIATAIPDPKNDKNGEVIDLINSPPVTGVIDIDGGNTDIRGNSPSTPTSTRQNHANDSPGEEPSMASHAQPSIPLRLRLLRSGLASVDSLRDVVG